MKMYDQYHNSFGPFKYLAKKENLWTIIKKEAIELEKIDFIKVDFPAPFAPIIP